jgi:hypothetical protein
MMIRHPRTRARKSASLIQAQADFTAEGAPPPGQVATQAPVLPAAAATAVRPAPAKARGNARKGPAPVGRHRW